VVDVQRSTLNSKRKSGADKNQAANIAATTEGTGKQTLSC
jgi:hypothetical protein